MATVSEFLSAIGKDSVFALTVLLTLGVIFVNGWTDAPNAIATCVTTRCLPLRTAVMLAAVFNFFGVWISTVINASVAVTVFRIADFGSDSVAASRALSAALVAIVLWAIGAWAFGIPTSESHALLAGISGAAIAVRGFRSINGDAWLKVIIGLILSVGLGLLFGWLICRGVIRRFRNADRRRVSEKFRIGQIGSACLMSFMHGAQDGQKFAGILLLALSLSLNGQDSVFRIPLWLIMLCSVVMALGTAVGGKKIIKAVGMDMVKLERYQGFSADLASGICLIFSSAFGLPVSTTHVKTSAILGAGAARGRRVKLSVVYDMALAWILTFPACALIGFGMAKLFTVLFG